MLLKEFEHRQTANEVTVWIDEVGRGCLFGPVVACAVIWDNDVTDAQLEEIKDSKKLSKKKRERLKKFIEDNAKECVVCFIDNDRIDEINILNATIEAMHGCLKKIKLNIDRIVVDGNFFKEYRTDDDFLIPHCCIPKGDDTYLGIAAASIVAKVTRDQYIEQLVEDNKELKEYKIEKNMGYGTSVHCGAIIQHGITKWHRKTFGRVKEYV